MCEGCSILEKSKPFHCYLDYEKCSEADVLFLSDSLKTSSFTGEKVAFSARDIDLLVEILGTLEGECKFEFAASVKCPTVKAKDMKTDDKKICRTHVEATIDRIKPKLIFACGALPMEMVIAKKGLTGPNAKRGKSFPYTSPNGHECVVVPVFHPFQVINEPKNRFLFELDIRNGYNRHILQKTSKSEFSYEVLETTKDLDNYRFLFDTTEAIAIDIETNGLDFKKNVITTISLSWGSPIQTLVIPFRHKHSPFHPDLVDGGMETDIISIKNFLRPVLGNPNNYKVFHNAKFDLKFLIHEGIRDYKNVIDTAILAHEVDENTPNRLLDVTQQYFADEVTELCLKKS